MFRNVAYYVEFICKNNLTQSQFLFLYLMRFKEFDSMTKYMEAFPTDDKSMIGKPLIEDLINRDFIRHIGDGTKPSNYIITDKFNHLFLNNHFMAADEIWRKYPSYVSINGKNIPLLTMDVYQFANLYAERIKYDVNEHLEVIKDVEYGRKNNLLSSSIENFTRSEGWMSVRKIRLGNQEIAKVSLTDSF